LLGHRERSRSGDKKACTSITHVASCTHCCSYAPDEAATASMAENIKFETPAEKELAFAIMRDPHSQMGKTGRHISLVAIYGVIAVAMFVPCAQVRACFTLSQSPAPYNQPAPRAWTCQLSPFDKCCCLVPVPRILSLAYQAKVEHTLGCACLLLHMRALHTAHIGCQVQICFYFAHNT